MGKEELRKREREGLSAAGDAGLELTEVRKLQEDQPEGIHTITVGCGYFLSLVCCGE